MNGPTALPFGITNHGLFEDYYLRHRLEPTLPTHPDLARLLAEVGALWRQQQGQLAGGEANVSAFVRDVCRLLGMVPTGQSLVRRRGQSTLRVDITLFADTAAANAFDQVAHARDAGTASLYQDALAVVEVETLGAAFETRKEDNTNPSYQIVAYLTYTGRPWGILTDGARWRLYHRFDPPRLDTYLEIDLAEILALTDAAEQRRAFSWYLAFFVSAAFSTAATRGFLDQLWENSTRYAVEVQENLRQQAFAVVEALAQGLYVAAPTTTLPTIYEQAIIILYRLLFIKYAEDREILPVHNPTYSAQYGFSRLQDELLAGLDDPAVTLSGTALTAWQRLDAFFAAIDQGDPNAGIYGYDGGLFLAGRLAGAAVPDYYLAQALDKLARIGAARIDYRDLAVRHLGSIYEGLLEKRLKLVGRAIYLVTQTGTRVSERHRSGSYYTPDFIVEYLVKSTLEPLCRAAEAVAIEQIRVCDPAMGSGHFLVAALDMLAYHHATARKYEYLTRNLPPGMTPEALADEAVPTAAEQSSSRRILVERCLYGVDLNPLAVELAKLSLWLHTLAPGRALSFLDHQLCVGNSLVGAPADPATLAALPARPARPAPVGARAPTLFAYSFEQQVQTLVTELDRLQALPSTTAQEVAAKAAAYAAVDAKLDRFRQVANAHVAVARGLALGGDEYAAAALAVSGDDATWQLVAGGAAWQAAQQQAATDHYFHWWLAFPEVFFPSGGGAAPGFHAVLANPPYVRWEYAVHDMEVYLAAIYPQVSAVRADLYVYFIAQGLALLRAGGRLAYITSNTWLRANYGTPLRRFLRTEVTVDEVVDLGDNQVFKQAPDVHPALLRLRRDPPPPDHRAPATVFRRATLQPVPLAPQVEAGSFILAVADQPDGGWQLVGAGVRDLFNRLIAQGRPLHTVVGGRMYYGVKTGLNEAFIIERAARDRLTAADPAAAVIIKPMMRGEDLRPWYQEDEGRYLILLPNGWTATTFGTGLDETAAWQQFSTLYPALAGHLAPFAEAARRRRDQGQYWWELRPCDYYAAFEQPKIFWPDIAKFPRFSWDDRGFYLGNTGYILLTSEAWLLGYLASRCAWFALSQIAVGLGERAGLPVYRLTDQYMRQLPIPDPDAVMRGSLARLAQELTEQAQERYTLHCDTRERIRGDLRPYGHTAGLNHKLTAWWELADLAALRAELDKAWGADIPLKERGAWSRYLADQQAAHQRLTGAIVLLETELNDQVYRLFGLTAAEQALIEQQTQYRYGEE